MPTYRVDVNPDLLVWARETMGLSLEEAARRLRIDPLTLRFWELGADELAQPTLVQLRELALLYDRPLPLFYLPAPPKEESPNLPDFRLLPDSAERAWSVAMRATYRRVVMQRDVAIELAEAAEDLPAPIAYTLTMGTSPDLAGEDIRAWLGIGIDTQLSWSSEYEALNSWISAIERRGVLVAHSQQVSLDEMRGFSISGRPFPAIVLNGYDKPRARIFTLFHELSHILMHSGGLCNVTGTQRYRVTGLDIESYCNRVSGAVLLPKSTVLADLADLGIRAKIDWPDLVLADLANRYHVSREVVLRRMVSLGYATLDQYLVRLSRYNAGYRSQEERDRQKRDQDRKEGRKRGGPNPLKLRLRNLGYRYSGTVLRAYDRRDINADELSDYLDTKLDHIPTLVEILASRR